MECGGLGSRLNSGAVLSYAASCVTFQRKGSNVDTVGVVAIAEKPCAELSQRSQTYT